MNTLELELFEFLKDNNLEMVSNDSDKIIWKSKLELRCITCGNTFNISIKQLLRPHPERNGMVCTKCDDERKFISKLNEKYGRNPYEFLTVFSGYDKLLKVKCKDCGFEWEATAKSLLMNSKLKDNCHPCKMCTKMRRDSTKNISELENELINKFGECNYTFPEPKTYAGLFSKEKIRIICKICGHEMFTHVGNILNPSNSKHYCRVCNNKDRLLENMSYKERCLITTNNAIEPLEEYVDSRTKIKHKCNICGYGSNGEWLKIPVKNTLKNAGCPNCTKKVTISKCETEITDYIKEIYTGSISLKDKTVLEGKEIDVYVPELKIGFEINGLYWHSEKYKGKKYHLEKTMAAYKSGIRIVHIFEDEWYHKKDICKDKIANILKCTQNRIVYARKCSIHDDMKSKDKTAFLEKYHIQGKDSASITVSLKYEGETVAVMTFAKPRVSLGRKSGNVGEYELSRFACSCNVVGAFSKLLKYAIKKYNITTINTYADIRWSSIDKNVYVTNGFKEIRKSDPGYWYFNKNESSTTVKRIHRFNFRKQELSKKFPHVFDKDKTEFEIMDAAGYCRIWDCGNIVYKLEV